MLEQRYTPKSRFDFSDDNDEHDSSAKLYSEYSEEARKNPRELSPTKTSSNADGSKLERDKQGRICSIEYPDRTMRQFERDKNGDIVSIAESDGSRWSKARNSKDWFNDKNQELRKDLSVSYEGTLSYKDERQSSHTIDRTGLHKCRNIDRSSIELKAGLVQKLQRPDGARVECSYEDGELKNVKINNKESYVFSQNQWLHIKNGKENPSQKPLIQPDGSCTFQRGDIAAVETILLNGAGSIKYKDGACSEFGSDGKSNLIKRPNGSQTEFFYKNGQLDQVKETYIDKKTALWRREGGKWWSLDQPGRSYQSIAVSSEGVINYDTGEKYKFRKFADGTQQSSSKDGASWFFDERKRIVSYTRADGSRLLYEHSNPSPNPQDKGKLLRVRELSKTGEEAEDWKRSESDNWTSSERPQEIRAHLEVNAQGECSYVSMKDGEVTGVKYPSGSSRSFERFNGEINKIKNNDGKGGKIIWQRSENAAEWTDGKSKEMRERVNVSPAGELSYETAENRRITYTKEDREIQEAIQKPELTQETKAASDRLLSIISTYPANCNDLAHFRSDLETFANSISIRGLSEAAAKQALDQLSEMLESDSSEAPFSKVERAELAKQAVRHLAHPREIDQGWHNTCNVATIQILTATQNPENFTAILKEVATTGKFTSKQNLEVKLDPESLKADFEAKEYNPYKQEHNDGIRSLASQVFQVAAINSFYVATKSPLRYIQTSPEKAGDNGERLVNPGTKSIAAKQPRLTADNMVEIGKQINGKAPIIIASSAVGNKKTINISSETELKKKIQDLEDKKQLPVIVEVFTDHEPYRQESGPGGCHVVTLWGMDKSGKILMDNQWGKNADHEGISRLSTAQVYKALQP